MGRVLALVNRKGGVGKSTSAVYLATGLAWAGPALLVDADPQQTALKWAQLAGDGFPPTVGLPTPGELQRRLPELAARYAHVVVDTPPGSPDTPPGSPDISRAAVLAADLVVIPTSPTMVDLDRLRPTLELLAEVEGQHPAAVRVLLTRVRSRTIAAAGARAFLDGHGLPLLRQAITLREAYAASFGLVVADLGEYQAVLGELAAVAPVAR